MQNAQTVFSLTKGPGEYCVIDKNTSKPLKNQSHPLLSIVSLSCKVEKYVGPVWLLSIGRLKKKKTTEKSWRKFPVCWEIERQFFFV